MSYSPLVNYDKTKKNMLSFVLLLIFAIRKLAMKSDTLVSIKYLVKIPKLPIHLSQFNQFACTPYEQRDDEKGKTKKA